VPVKPRRASQIHSSTVEQRAGAVRIIGGEFGPSYLEFTGAAQGILCSMSRKGDCWDNAATESFFSTLKTERTRRRRYTTRDDARADVFDYIERFYNPRRRHSTLGQVSPDQFEKASEDLG